MADEGSIRIEIEKWNKSNIPYSVYIGDDYFEDLSYEVLLGKIIKEIEKLKSKRNLN